MSSPPETTGLDDAATRKRERATSMDPAPAERDESDEPMEKNEESAKAPVKKTKHGGDSSVRAIRKNLKEMKTTDMTWANEEDADDHMQAVVEQNESDDVHMASVNDKKRGPDEVYEHSAATDTNDIEPDANVNTDAPIPPASPRKKPTRRDTAEIELLHEQKESSESEKEDKSSPKKTSLFAQFSGKSSSSATNGDDWDDFAEEETPSSKPSSQQEKEKPKPKYAFGSSSGFGTKGWGAAHQTAPIPGGSPFRSTGKTTFGGFGSSAFGASSTLSSSQSSAASTPSFSSFANSTASPFALLAAKGSTTNALSSLPQRSTSVEKDAIKATKSDDDSEGDESGDDNDDNESASSRGISPQTFGVEQKVKLPGLKRTELTTGEEDEYTVHTVKAKLLVIDGSSENWKERGTGTLRINTKKTNGNTAARLVMRADSVFRVILNVPLFAGMKVWIMQEKFVRFAGFETVEPSESAEKKDETVGSTKLVNYALKVGSSSSAQDLYDMIIAHLPRSE